MTTGDPITNSVRFCNCTGYLSNGGRCCMDGPYVQPSVTWPGSSSTWSLPPKPTECEPTDHDFEAVEALYLLYCRKCGTAKPIKPNAGD